MAAAKSGAHLKELNKAYPHVQEVPFHSERKRMITIHKIENPRAEDISPFYNETHKDWYAITVKGAPDMVLDLCQHYQRMDDHVAPLDENQKMRILAANDQMTQEALRVLGMAYRITPELPDISDPEKLEQDLVFAGLTGMIDPPRPEVPPALAKGRQAGIRTVMITGDYANTARAIAESIGLLRAGHQVLSGADLNEMDDETLKHEVTRTDVFARVSPEHKMRIVEALRAQQRGGGDDRRRRQRCAVDQTGRYRRGDGDHRHGCRQRKRRYGAHG